MEFLLTSISVLILYPLLRKKTFIALLYSNKISITTSSLQVAASFAAEGAGMSEMKQWNDLYGEGGSRKQQQLSYFLWFYGGCKVHFQWNCRNIFAAARFFNDSEENFPLNRHLSSNISIFSENILMFLHSFPLA